MKLLAYLYRHQIPCPEVAVWEDLLRENGRAEGPMVGYGDGGFYAYQGRTASGQGDGDNLGYGLNGRGMGSGDGSPQLEGDRGSVHDGSGDGGDGTGDGNERGSGLCYGDGTSDRTSEDKGLLRCTY